MKKGNPPREHICRGSQDGLHPGKVGDASFKMLEWGSGIMEAFDLVREMYRTGLSHCASWVSSVAERVVAVPSALNILCIWYS